MISFLVTSMIFKIKPYLIIFFFIGAMTFTAVVLFIAKFPFDFGETFRSDNMGWTEITEFDELVG